MKPFEIIKTLTDAGWSVAQIAKSSNLSYLTVRKISIDPESDPRFRVVESLRALLGMPPPEKVSKKKKNKEVIMREALEIIASASEQNLGIVQCEALAKTALGIK